LKHKDRDLEIILINDEQLTGKLTLISEDENKIGVESSIKEKGVKKIRTEYREINFSDIKESRIKLKF